MSPSIQIPADPRLLYLLRLEDACLIHAQRKSEWCGHGPIIEEDMALTNMSLDLIGQARALLTQVGALSGKGYDEDQLAFLREERDYLNPTLVELPGRKAGRDFADAMLRNLMVATWLHLWWQRLQASSDAEVAAIAGKAVKEARYHREHASDWVIRLGDGSDESARRMREALARLWPYGAELFAADEADAAAVASGLGPSRADLQPDWMAAVLAVLAEAKLVAPAPSKFVPTGSQGVHSEHLGFMLAEMQYLQRAYPGGKW
jgi:ring-1,2-phenylacetyl-CoA epoxidase subunit PaaC